MTLFETWVQEYDYVSDSNGEVFNQLFLNSEPIKMIGIDVYSDSAECNLILRTKVKKPTVTIDRGLVWFRDSDRYQTVVCDIPIDSITDRIFKRYADNLYEYLIMLDTSIYYKMTISF